MVIHFIGLGGAGKTTTAKLLALKMNIPYFDLDEYFIENKGSIAQFIDQHGYDDYAKRNLELYFQIKNLISDNAKAIIVCSSGFMSYPENIVHEYLELKQYIENDQFTFLLMPSFDVEECVEIIVKRQMARTYLNAIAEKEEIKARKRFELYKKLKCKQIITGTLPVNVVDEIQVKLLKLI